MLSNKPGYPPPTIRLLRIQVPRWERNHRGILRRWWRVTGWGKLKKKFTHWMVNQSCFQSDSLCHFYMFHIVSWIMLLHVCFISWSCLQIPSHQATQAIRQPSNASWAKVFCSRSHLKDLKLEWSASSVSGKMLDFNPWCYMYIYIYIFSFIPFTVYLTSHCVCLVWFLGWLVPQYSWLAS